MQQPLHMFYEKGFILVTTMLFLLILSLLAFSVLEVGLLEDKMNGFYQDKVRSFYLAESYLQEAEEKLPTKMIFKNVRVKLINFSAQGRSFYRLKAWANYRGSKTCLESTWAVTHGFNVSKRHSFLIRDC